MSKVPNQAVTHSSRPEIEILRILRACLPARYVDQIQRLRLVRYMHAHESLYATAAKWTFTYWLLTRSLKTYRHIRARGLLGSVREIVKRIQSYFINIFISLPFVSAKVASELSAVHKELSTKLAPKSYPSEYGITTVKTLPANGRSREWLENEWKGLKRLEKSDVADGRVSGAVYHGGDDLTSIINDAMAKFTVSNPLHPDVFPGIRKMESEIVSMCLDLFNASNGAGTTTSGGTESILMAVKTYRDWAKATKGITEPEMIVPSSAHAAFWKASEYFRIKLHVIPVDEKTRKADVRLMRRAISAGFLFEEQASRVAIRWKCNPNTIMLVASAPNFPDGAVDPIVALGKLAKKYRIGLHVDCCLGSFIMPFLKRAGFGDGIDGFDFSVEGVTSISCDIHKYAFCPKGSSVIMYSSKDLRRYQYYVMPDWAGGLYASPSMAGSRPGSVLAGAWAVMNHMGIDGYTQSCHQILTATRHFTQTIRTRFAADLYILGDPRVSVVAFGSTKPSEINIYAVGDGLSKKGWHLNGLQNPAALHMAFTRLTAMSVDTLINDIQDVLDDIKREKKDAAAAGEEGKKGKDGGQMVALYGMGQTSVGPFVVSKVAEIFLDVLYE